MPSRNSRSSPTAIQPNTAVRHPASSPWRSSRAPTNSHGAVYEFFRDDAFDAKDYFATESSRTAATSSDRRLGFPIVRDGRSSSATSSSARSARQQPGDLDASLRRRSVLGRFSSSVRDPLTGQPFPDNQIPASRHRSDRRQDRSVTCRCLRRRRRRTTSSTTAHATRMRRRAMSVSTRFIGGNQNFYFRYSFQDNGGRLSPPAATRRRRQHLFRRRRRDFEEPELGSRPQLCFVAAAA